MIILFKKSYKRISYLKIYEKLYSLYIIYNEKYRKPKCSNKLWHINKTELCRHKNILEKYLIRKTAHMH